jgi:hypothetical protein
VLGLCAREQIERMPERRLEDVKAVAHTAHRPGQVDDQRVPAHARNAAPQETVRRLADCVRAQRFRDPGHVALDHRLGRFGSEIARRDTGSTRCDDEPGGARELTQRRRDLRTLVGDDSMLDVESFCGEEIDE